MTVNIRAIAANAAAKGFAMTDAPQAVTLRRVIPGTYNPATGKTGPATTTDYPAHAIIGTYSQHEIAGTSILATDRKALIRQAEVALAGEVTTGDKLVVGGKTFSIIGPVGQDAVGCMWILQVRG